jgi:formamidopyrimidine-DNA glycosylase
MPEMPEVETIARKLRKSIVGKRVAEVCLSGLKLRKPVPESFADSLRGREIRNVRRRGKYLIVELRPRAFWLIHLGMSGRVLCRLRPMPPVKHTQAIIRFTDRSELEYRDPRRFGLLAAYEVSRPGRIPEIQRLGKDPLGDGFQAAWLWPQLQASRTEIKSFLLDQRRIAGLGNIYVCEALYHAGVHPLRRCSSLSRREAARLVWAIRKVLRLAIRNRGTSFSDFMDSDGEPGTNQRFLRVFQREGEKCRRCHREIERIHQGNRSSYSCPGCQV